jgi:DNA polymerase/3'-5' exonuclease PolX
MRRIDVLGVPFDELPAALTYFTGNDVRPLSALSPACEVLMPSRGNQFFNRSLRLKAGHMGMRLNQRGLYKNVSPRLLRR